jgi:ribonuclease P protein component
MLSKQNRLSSVVIPVVIRTGKRVFTDTFQMTIVANTLPVSRFSFIVSKKTAKHAVDRNRMKRIISESIRLRLLEIKPGFDCVIVAKKNFSSSNTKDIGTLIHETLKKNNLLMP